MSSSTQNKIQSPLSTLIVSKAQILATTDYNLTASRYRVTEDFSNAKWDMVELGEVCDVRDGTHDSPKQVSEGYPLITSKNIKNGDIDFSNISYISDEDFKKVSKRSYVDIDDIIMPMIGTIGGACLIRNKDIEFAIKNVALFKRSENFLPLYLLNILRSESVKSILEASSSGATQKFVSLSALRSLKIPLPPLHIQEDIVREIEGYQAIIDGAKKVIENWKPKIDIDPEWQKVKLGEVCEKIFAGGDVPKDNFSIEKTDKYNIPIFTNGLADKSLYGFTNVQKVTEKAVTISARGTIGYPVLRTEPFYPAVRLIVAIPNKTVTAEFLQIALSQVIVTNNGNSIPQLTVPMIQEESFFLPSLGVQKQIVEKIEEERKLVEGNKKLVEIYEGKIKDVIQKVWR